MRILLARHGNTFGPSDAVVWLGGQANLPLVDAGIAQAHALAHTLHTYGVCLAAVHASPLVRTTVFAKLARPPSAHAVPVQPQDALVELDYGLWAGRTRAQLLAAGQNEALGAWERSSVYPKDQGFAPPVSAVQAKLTTWLTACMRHHGNQPGLVLAVSHGGTLRLLHQMLVSQDSQTPGKMACGHVGVLGYRAGRWHVDAWNVAPQSDTLHALVAPPSRQRL